MVSVASTEIAPLPEQRREDHGVGSQPCPFLQVSLFGRLDIEGRKKPNPATQSEFMQKIADSKPA